MRAVVLREPKPIEQNPIDVEDAPIPNVAKGQLLVKITACGVCRSNLHMIEGDWVKYGVPTKSPIIPGHEIVGRVEEMDDDVEGFNVGEKVGLQPLWLSCGRCEYCLSGREHLCRSKEMTGETVDGGYAEYIVANADYAYHVPDNLKDSEAAPLFCPGITAYGAVKKAELTPDKRVAIFGVGGVGHMVVQLARLYGAEVIAVSRSSQHLALAKELGASVVIDASKGDVEENLRKMGPIHSSIVFAPSSKSVQQAMKVTKPEGTVVVGVWAELGEFVFPDEKKIIGSSIGSRQDMKQVLSLASSGKIKPVCEEFGLEAANDVLRKLKRGEILARAVLVP